MTERVFNVLFLCTGNSARSVLAEAIMNAVGKGRFRAFSTGSRPKGEVNRFVLELLQKQGFDVSGLRSKSWGEFAAAGAPDLDFVFTVCDNAAGSPCPIWPGHPTTAHWGIADPAVVEGGEAEQRRAFATAFDQLHRRISLFISLPLERLDEMARKRELDEIGRLREKGQ